MQGIKPRTLSNSELIKLGAALIDSKQGMPLEWQFELMRRFMALAPSDQAATVDPRQLELPL